MAGLPDYPRYFNQPTGKSVYNFLIGVPEAEKARQNQRDMETIRQSLPTSQQRPNQTEVRQAVPAALPATASAQPVAANTQGQLSYLGDQAQGRALQERTANAQTAAPLISAGYRSLNNPVVNAAINGGSPGYDDNIMVKERLASPKEYTQAIQARQAATEGGQRVGFTPSLGSQPYQPNDATRVGITEGGPVTEYVIPGKGTATFLGQRQGGGTFSVASGRTPEEQAAIDQRVASIDSQTAAMRSLRNANRQEQGLPTVEQEQQANAIRSFLSQFAPNTSGLDQQQAELMKQLEDAKGIRGKGERSRREDAIRAAQIGLAQIAAQRGDALNQANSQLGFAQNLYQSDAAQSAAAAKQQQDFLQWTQEHGLDVAKLDADQQKGLADYYLRSLGVQQKDQELAIAANKAGNSFLPDAKSIANLYVNPIKPGDAPTLNPQALQQLYNIGPAPQTPSAGVPYFDPKSGQPYMLDQQGKPQTISVESAIAQMRALEQGRLTQ